MLQLSVTVVLVISMFAGTVSPVMQQEVEVNDKGNRPDAVLNNTSSTLNDTISNNVSNKSIEQTVKVPENTSIPNAEKAKEINANVSSESVPDAGTATSVNDSKSVENKKSSSNCTSNKEQEDMLRCTVSVPPDDDEEPTTVTNIASNKIEANAESQVPENKENSGKNKTETTVNTTRTTDLVHYEVVTTEPDHFVNDSDVSNTDLKSNNNNNINNNTSEASIVSSLLEENKAAISSDNVEAVKSAESEAKRMPSGVIALVTAISFAVAIALVYVGMIIWRRYVEYRYGHRELLVNELEFDTNDLRHFEL